MKKNLLYIICIATLLPISVFSMSVTHKTILSQFEQIGDTLYIRFSLDLNDVNIMSKHRMLYTPILVSDSMEVSLPIVSMQGRNNLKSLERRALLTDSVPANIRYISFKSRDSDRIVDYTYSLLYEPWMKDAGLKLRATQICRCDKLHANEISLLCELLKLELVPVTAILDESFPDETGSIIKTSPFVANISSYEADIKALGTRRDSTALTFYFRLNESILDGNFSSNKEALRKIKVAITEINNTKSLSVSKILIAGFASIEGTTKLNERLSKERAESISDYILARINVEDSIVNIHNGAEDWAGLRIMASASTMPDKTKVLDIIDNVSNLDDRERQLKSLSRGRTYLYMLQNFFSQQRHVDYVKVYFDVKKDNVAQQINLAVEAVKTKRYDDALEILNSVSEDPRTDAVFGVCYMMLGDFAQAKAYLQKAADRGDTNAQSNLEQVLRDKKKSNKLKY